MSDQPIYAIGYARVSTPKQAISGDSLDGQEDDIRAYCEEKGYTLFPSKNKVFLEPFTGTSASRPEYDEIIKLIKKNPNKIKYFVVRLISRMTRGEVANYYLMKAELKSYGVKLKDVSGIIQDEQNHFNKYGLEYEWSVESPSETSELMEVKRSETNRKAILRQLLEAEILLVREGYHIGVADDGYTSKRIDVDLKKRYVLEPDTDRAKYYIAMFNLRAEGTYSDQEIVDKLNAMGFKTRVRKRWNKNKTVQIGVSKQIPLTVKSLQRIIKRYCYCAVLCEKWTNQIPIKAKWKGLVDIDIFNKANRGKIYVNELMNNRLEILYDKNINRLVNKRNNFRSDYPFKNIILCPKCRKPFLASASTGKMKGAFPSYHCTRGHARYAVKKKILEKVVNDFLLKIRFTDKFLLTVEKTVFKKYRSEEGTFADKSNMMSKKVIELKEKKVLKLKAIETSTSEIVKRDLETEYEQLHIEMIQAQAERNLLDVTEDQIHDFLQYAKYLMEHPTEMLEKPSNKHEQLALYSLFFDGLPTYEEILSGTPKLTLLFKVKNENSDDKSQSVTSRRIELRLTD